MQKFFIAVNSTKGIWVTLLIATALLFAFYGRLILNADKVYFSASGDGLQSYYTALYHIKHDSSYSVFGGMNYPYGEQVLYTNCQPAVSNVIRFVSLNITDISGCTVAMINLMMLFSIVVAALFLYLIFRGLGVQWLYASLAAAGIAFLSPQIQRFTGHYSLSYVFTIPAVIFFLLKFHRNKSWKISLVLGLFILLMSTFHAYHFGMAAFLLGSYWIVQVISDAQFRKWKFLFINITLQIVLPVAVITAWLWLTQTAHDRTSCPWGFTTYRSAWEGIFLNNSGMDSLCAEKLLHPQDVNWEGWAFIGHLSAIVYFFVFTVFGWIPFAGKGNVVFWLVILILGIALHILLKKRFRFFSLTENKFLNILLWAGFLSMFLSFGWPFIWSERFMHWLGPLQQFRGIGRFAWIFFYAINIAAFYFVFNLKIKKKWFRIPLLAASLLLLFYDAFTHNNKLALQLNNSIEEWCENDNIRSDQKGFLQINPGQFQSILPLPFFHIGSENMSVDERCASVRNAYLVSLKTGLPIHASMMSRTSISQSNNNIELVLEAYKKPGVLRDLPSHKPILLVVTHCSDLTQPEKLLIAKSERIMERSDFDLYTLQVETIEHLADSLFSSICGEIGAKKLFDVAGFSTTDSIENFIYNGFSHDSGRSGYYSRGAYTGLMGDYHQLYRNALPSDHTAAEYVISFWLRDVQKDLRSRSIMDFNIYNAEGKKIFGSYSELRKMIKNIDGEWALIEYPFIYEHPSDTVSVLLLNREISRNTELVIDEFFIRPAGCDIYRNVNDSIVMKNNRYYSMPVQSRK